MKNLRGWLLAGAFLLLLIVSAIFQDHYFFGQVNDATQFGAEIIRAIAGWPLVALMIAALLVASRSVNRLIDRIQRLDFSGLSIELDEAGKLQLEERFNDVSDIVRAYRDKVSNIIKREVNTRDLDAKLASLNDILRHAFPGGDYPPGYRSTIHIPDPVLDRRLYQLLNYYSADGKNAGGAGRIFSVGFGIIGRVWRSGLNDLEGELLHRPASGSALDDVSRICLEWGMSREEALKVREQPSYLCYLIKFEGQRVGLFYADSTEKFAFAQKEKDEKQRQQSTDAIFRQLEAAIAKTKFDEALQQLSADLRKVSLRLEIG